MYYTYFDFTMAYLGIYSIHVNWPGGLEGATWPLHDPTGYSEAEKSMAGYGRANFSEQFVFLRYTSTDLTASQVQWNANDVHCPRKARIVNGDHNL
jgi:hypothetical protein